MEVNKNPDAGLSFTEYYNRVASELKAKGYESAPDHNEVADDYAKNLSVSESVEEYVTAWGDPGDEDGEESFNLGYDIHPTAGDE